MSWSISLYDEPLSIDDFEAAARAKFDALTYTPPLGDDAREQLDVGIAAARAIAESGVAGPGPYKGAVSGHANPGHEPTPGWANDCVSVSLADGRPEAPPAQ